MSYMKNLVTPDDPPKRIESAPTQKEILDYLWANCETAWKSYMDAWRTYEQVANQTRTDINDQPF
jgi:hypothetical protein